MPFEFIGIREAAVIIFLSLLIVPGIGSGYPVADSDSALNEINNSNDIAANVSIERMNNSAVRYRIEFTVREHVDSVSVSFRDRIAVVRTDGFERPETEPGLSRYEFTGNDTATVVIEQDLGSAAEAGTHVLATDSWLLTRVPYVGVSWVASNADHRYASLFEEHASVPFDTNATVDNTDGFVKNRYLYVGSYTLYSSAFGRNPGCEVYVPATVTIQPSKYCTAVESADRYLGSSVPNRTESGRPITAVVLPDVESASDTDLEIASDTALLGVANSEAGFVVVESAPASVWIHEYVHTVQRFEAVEEMLWLSEGSAEYYEQSVGYRNGVVDETDIEDRFSPDPNAKAVLANSTTWDSSHVPYMKGARAVGYFDSRIRNLTEGERDFRDVLARLNNRSEPVTLQRFKNTVETVVGGDELDEEIDRVVLTREQVNARARLVQIRATNITSPVSETGTGSRPVPSPFTDRFFNRLRDTNWIGLASITDRQSANSDR